jgi:hypothetical protein
MRAHILQQSACKDKAVTRLPWGIVAKFTYDVVQHSADFSLGTKTAFKEYIGSHELSPFAITTPEFMGDMLDVGKTMMQGPAMIASGWRPPMATEPA